MNEVDDLDIDDVHLEDEDEFLPEPISTPRHFSEEERQKVRWMRTKLDVKFRDVMGSLKESRRWDKSSGDSRYEPLEEWKKASLMKGTLAGDRTSPTFLQMLARYREEFSGIPKDVRNTIVRDTLERRERSINSSREDAGQPILTLAVGLDNDDFIDCVIECWSEEFADLVGERNSEGRNCLHLIFLPNKTESLRRKALERGKKILPKARPEFIAAKDNDGNTPIHYAMNYRQCMKRDADYVKLVKKMLEEGDRAMLSNGGPLNNKNESPILYCLRTREELKRAQMKLNTPAPQTAQRQNGPVKPAPGDQMRQPGLNTKEFIQCPVDQVPGPEKPSKNRFSNVNLGEEPRLALDKGVFNIDQRTIAPNMTAPQPQMVNTNLSHSTNSLSLGTSQIQPNATSKKLDKTSGERVTKRAEGELLSVKTLLEILKRHYICTRLDLEARNLIYGLNMSETNLYFDASGHKTAQDVVRLMDRMSHGGFSDTLAYVYVPTVAHEEVELESKSAQKVIPMNHGAPLKRTARENPNIGRSALISVFDRLYSLKVRKILRLEVEDRRAPSHTDAAIEMALQGRDSLSDTDSQSSRPISVEIWDWRKPDLSIEVIAFAAPDVEEISLYWSGNQAILKAWSYPEGMARLKQLKTVNIYAAPGLETMDRMHRMLKRFESDVRRGKDGEIRDIKVHIRPRISGLYEGLDSPREATGWITSQVQGEKQHDWIQRIEAFRSALRVVHEEFSKQRIEPERVKVALIDDGIDLNRLDAYHSKTWIDSKEVKKDMVKALGLTYCVSDGRSQSPWTQSSGGHGTIMANMILRINPWVSLYSMKLQDGQDNDGRRTIFSDSAANAIRGAISRRVDIMSMSWSVRNRLSSSSSGPAAPAAGVVVAGSEAGSVKMAMRTDASPIKMLEDAVDEAVSEHILIFCSATDDIQVGALDFLPYQKAPNYIFRIGAANAHGQRDPRSEDEKHIEYLFPGNQVAESWNPRSETRVRYHDGSSVSTALAAGLASLIMYLALVVATYYGEKSTASDPKKHEWFWNRARLLRNRTNMKRAFDNIDSEAWLEKKFLPVWDLFGQATTDMEATRDLATKVGVLEKLVSELCSKIK